MSNTIFILLWMLALLAFKFFVNVQTDRVYVLGKPEQREPLSYAVFCFAPVIIMATFRGYIADSAAYIRAYKEIPDTIAGFISYIPSVHKDRGFSVLSGLIKCMFGSNHEIYFFIIAALQGLILVYIFRKYSINYNFSIFLFIASTDYMSWMFNGMRQFTAVVIIFAATTFMLEKRWKPTIFLILLAATIHLSALLMIPVVVIAQGKAWNKKSIVFLAATLVAVTFVDQFTNVLDMVMQETQYASMVDDWTRWGDDGTNALRVLVYSVPAIISVIGLPHIRRADDPVINLCTNMSIVTAGLYLVSMVTSGIFIGRLPIYTSLYNYILLPWQIENIFTKRSAQFVKIAAIAAYVLFYYYQMNIKWNYM